MRRTIIAVWMEAVVDRLRSQGVSPADLDDLRELLSGQSHSGQLFSGRLPSTAEFDIAVSRRLWNNAVALTGNPALGFDVGALLPPRAFHILALLCQQSPTLADALAFNERFQSIVSNNGRLTRRGGTGAYDYRATETETPISAAQIDSILGGLVAMLRATVQSDLRPLAVRSASPDGPWRERVEAFFQAPVTFGARKPGFDFAPIDLNRQQSGTDPILLRKILQSAEEQMAAQDQADGIAKAMSAVIAADPATPPSCREMARRLGLSIRSLQRHLADLDTSYRVVVLTARLQAAEGLLRRGNNSIGDISERVGYAEPAAFSRAFRGRYGTTPSEFRRLSRQSPESA